jgi:hypothetical protein
VPLGAVSRAANIALRASTNPPFRLDEGCANDGGAGSRKLTRSWPINELFHSPRTPALPPPRLNRFGRARTITHHTLSRYAAPAQWATSASTAEEVLQRICRHGSSAQRCDRSALRAQLLVRSGLPSRCRYDPRLVEML